MIRPPPTLPFSTLEQLKNAVNNFASLNRPWYDFVFTGGEPTLHPHMINLIYMLHDKLKDRLNEILIISNGSRNNELYRKLAEISKSVNIAMNISLHTDHVDMTHILELIENLSRDISIFFPIMFNPAKREEVHLIYDILYEYRKRFPFEMEVIPIRIPSGLDPRYTSEDILWIKETVEQIRALQENVKLKVPLSRKKLHTMHMFHDVEDNGERKIIETTSNNLNLVEGFKSFTGMYCVANSTCLKVEETGLCRGTIYQCSPNMCNIYEEDAFKAVRDNLIHAVQCPFPVCGCDTSNYIPKFSSPEEAIGFMKVFGAKQKALFDEYDAAQ